MLQIASANLQKTPMPEWEWTDARYFLAVAREGATLRAANRLGVNQTTCARRIAALEDALALKLFIRSGSGYVLTGEGRSLVPAAEALEAAAEAFSAAAGEAARRETRKLRLTTAEGLETSLIAPALSEARRRMPSLVCEVDVTPDRRDLVRGEADLALRASNAPQEPGVIYRRLRSVEWGVYRHVSYAKAVGPDNFFDHPIASLEGKPLEALRQMAPHARVVQITSTFLGLVATLRAGDCIGGLPTFVGDAQPDLVRCGIIPENEGPAIWIVYPERLRGREEVRVLIDCLVEQAEAAAAAA